MRKRKVMELEELDDHQGQESHSESSATRPDRSLATSSSATRPEQLCCNIIVMSYNIISFM